MRLTRWWFACATVLAGVGIFAGIGEPAFTLAGPGPAQRWATWTVLLGAMALAAARSRAEPATSVLLGLGLAGQLLAEAGGPGASSSTTFTMAVVLGGTSAALVVGSIAVRDRSPRHRHIGLGLVIVAAILRGPVAALLEDPVRAGCFACHSNLLAVLDSPHRAHLLGAIGAAVAVLAAAWSMARVQMSASCSSPRWLERLRATAAAAAVVALAVPAIASSPSRAGVGIARLIASFAVLVVAGCLHWEPWRRHRRRRALAALVARVAEAPTSASLDHALGAALGDTTLRILYPFDGGALIDARGEAVDAHSSAGTVLRRDGEALALVWHAAGVLDDAAEVDLVAATVGLALDHERQAAVLQARARVLASTRRRLIEASDQARRSLERDLHDHAQQRLVSILLALRLELDRCGGADPALAGVFEDVRDALEQVRSISHGVFPPAVADGGLACALEELSFALPDVVIDVRVGDVALSPVIEATAYLIAARCSEEAAASRVTVDVDADRLRLTVAFTTDHDPGSMVDLESRALALGGTWSTSARRVDVELPCAS